MDNPETQATLGTQDTGRINVRENRRGQSRMDNPETVSCVPSVACVSGLSILDCPLRFSLTFIRPVSCVPNVARFSGLSILDYSFGLTFM
jgi:hypothetical protein